MDRTTILQSILGLFERPSYLEIGVDTGDNFHALSAAHKVAVDPNFKFQPPADTATLNYFPLTSDVFFERVQPSRATFDVVFIDGLHTFEQTLRDLMNSLLLLSPGGVIVVDDVIPSSFHASLPSLDEAFRVRNHAAINQPALLTDNTWMGDVYKLVFFVNAFLQQLSYATVAESDRQLVLWHAPRRVQDLGTRSMLDVALLNFADTVLQREVFLIQPLASVMDRIRAVASVRRSVSGS